MSPMKIRQPGSQPDQNCLKGKNRLAVSKKQLRREKQLRRRSPPHFTHTFPRGAAMVAELVACPNEGGVCATPHEGAGFGEHATARY